MLGSAAPRQACKQTALAADCCVSCWSGHGCFRLKTLPILAINDKLLTKPVPEVMAGSKLTT
jgi:hypothetical protein